MQKYRDLALTCLGLSITGLAWSAAPMTQEVPPSAVSYEASLSDLGSSIVLQWTGPSARQIYEFLKTTAVVLSPASSVKQANGIVCSKNLNAEREIVYNCRESFDHNGADATGENPTPHEPLDGSYLPLIVRGAATDLLFQRISDFEDSKILNDGALEVIHLGERISCYRTTDKRGVVSQRCEQYLLQDGSAWSSGTDPVVTVGTRGLTALDVFSEFGL